MAIYDCPFSHLLIFLVREVILYSPNIEESDKSPFWPLAA